jgi:serine/threonine protein kinase
MMHPSMIERFKREHPAVVRVIDYGEAGVGACLVMEYVEGENLYDVLQAGALAPSRALPLLYQLAAEGLAAIHDKGIIHRDLKPENVLLTKGLRGEQAHTCHCPRGLLALAAAQGPPQHAWCRSAPALSLNTAPIPPIRCRIWSKFGPTRTDLVP